MAVAVVAVFVTDNFSPLVPGAAGLVGCLAAATVNDLLRIIAAKK